MQKKPIKAAAGFYDPINLSKDFPVTNPDFCTPPHLPHVHNCCEIGFCRSGAGIFIVEDKIFSCGAGDVIFINHQEFHILENASPMNSDWKFINFDPAGLLAGWLPPEEHALDVSRLSGRNFPNVIHEKDHPEITLAVRRLVAELDNTASGYRSAARALVWYLLVMLQRLVQPEDNHVEKDPAEIERVYPALKYISAHYAEPVDISRLAELCKCSLSTFRRLFHRSLGCMPLEYINEFRLKAAAAMLTSTSRSILEIALCAGFPTLSNFNRLFKAKFNKSPRDYRRDVAKG
ncbi:MAG: AraC family transcriptional regulator [Victivallaceae bacterium]|jgi:AraC-like DNA-binding protein